jgi:hypothetical protein
MRFRWWTNCSTGEKRALIVGVLVVALVVALYPFV